MIKFNQEQLDIIESINTNTMVSASAGAGKTTVLIGRLIKRILEDRVSLDQICAMTFTSKAAAEMKDRLSKALGQKLKENPDDIYIKEQFTLLASAQISTIHSFCLEVIKEFGYLLGIDPARTQNIFDEATLSLLKQQAMNSTINELLIDYEDDENFVNLLNFFSFKIVDYNKFSETIMKLSEVAYSNLDPQAYFDDILSLYQTSSLDNYPLEYQDLYWLFGEIHLENLNKKLISIITILDQLQETDKLPPYFVHQEYIQKLKQANQQRNLVLIRELLLKLFNTKTATVTKNEEMKKARNAYITKAGSTVVDFFNRPDDLSPNYPYVNLIVDATKRYTTKFNELKLEHQGLDFNDIEYLAYKILSTNELASNTLRNRYKEILVDEFQDSNYFQNEIVNLISKQDNVFRVGDTKQSIYGFRNAKPQLMSSIMNQDGEPFNKTLYLSNNFRSTYEIVEFNNILFETLMSIKGAPLSFSTKDWVGAPRKDINYYQNQNEVEIILLDREQEVDYEGFNKPTFNPSLLTSYFIAQDIHRRVNEHQIKYKDICVLIRNHGRKNDLKKAFNDLNIPYYIEDVEGFYHSYSVQDLLHFIKFILNPQDNIALTWVLLSSFVSYTEEQLAQLYLVNPKEALYNNLLTFDNELHSQLSRIIASSSKLDALDCVTNLLNFNQYYHIHLDTQQRTNIDLFTQQLNLYLQNPHQGLLGFVELVESLTDLKSSSASSISQEENVVRVFTIHQSKGLEYPVVYFFGFKDKNRAQELSDSLAFNPEYGLSLNLLDFEDLSKQPTLFDAIYKNRIQLDSISEEIRNLYVALTRAKEKLIIVSVDDDVEPKDIELFDLLDGDNYIKLILKSLPSTLNFKKDYKLIYKVFSHVLLNPIIANKPLVSKRLESELVEPVPLIEPIEVDFKKEMTLSLNLQSHYATDYGTKMHEILQTFSNDPNWFVKQQNNPQDIVLKLRIFTLNPFTTELLDYDLYNEVAISYMKDNQVFYGYMDLLAVKDDEVIMVDYKTDVVISEEQLVSRYSDQMNSYLEGLKKAYPDKKISQYLYSFDLHQYIQI